MLKYDVILELRPDDTLCTRFRPYVVTCSNCACSRNQVLEHEACVLRNGSQGDGYPTSNHHPTNFFSFFLALTVIPGPPLFSLTIRLRNPFPCPVTFVTCQRLLKQSFPDSASRLCTVGSATRPSSRPLRLELATGIATNLLLSTCRSATRR